MAERWLQQNVALVRGEDGPLASARAVLAALEPLLAKGQGVSCFFFMRKAPDMRLRFSISSARTQKRIGSVLESCKKQGWVRRHFSSVYEPEQRLFGGERAMSAVHAHFDADSRAFIAFDRWAQNDPAQVPPVEHVSGSFIDDLFCQGLEEASEVWDAWGKLGQLLPRTIQAAPLPPVQKAQATRGPLAQIQRRQRAANRALAKALSGLWAKGQLESGLRTTLSLVAWFHLNRWGLSPEGRRALIQAGLARHDPRPGDERALLSAVTPRRV